MKALVYKGPDDIRIEITKEPVPGVDDVLIRVKACGICGSDIKGYLGLTGRRIPPVIMGHEFSGEVVKTGRNVNSFKKGDRVVVQPVDFCGSCDYCNLGIIGLCRSDRLFGVKDLNGGMAEFISVPSKLLLKLPLNLEFVDGAMIEPMAVAHSAVKKAPSVTGKNVLVVGAGVIGLLLLQEIARKEPKILMVCDINQKRLDIARELGADFCFNPNEHDIIKSISGCTGTNMVDVSFEVVGLETTADISISSLAPTGTSIWIGNAQEHVKVSMRQIVTKEVKILGSYAYTQNDFKEALGLLSEGSINIDPIVSDVVSIDEGPSIFRKLAGGQHDMIKVILKP